MFLNILFIEHNYQFIFTAKFLKLQKTSLQTSTTFAINSRIFQVRIPAHSTLYLNRRNSVESNGGSRGLFALGVNPKPPGEDTLSFTNLPKNGLIISYKSLRPTLGIMK